MVFENLSVFQNVLFWFACAGLIVLVAYLICFYAGFANAKRGLSDDIDNPHENFQTRPFIANAFSLKGSIVFLAIFSALGFLLSLSFQNSIPKISETVLSNANRRPVDNSTISYNCTTISMNCQHFSENKRLRAPICRRETSVT